MKFSLDDLPSQKGRIAVVTGANTGLGFETALALASKEAQVVMACRNLKKGEEAMRNILEKVPGARIELMEVDLSKLGSVRTFAETYLQNHDRLDLLINNAGVMMPPYTKTEDGFELQLAANYIGHFLLTKRLFSTLANTSGSRIISLSSLVHKKGEINFDDFHSRDKYSASKAYGQSKLACLLFAKELQRRLEREGFKQTLSVAAHPGLALTDLGRHFPKVMYGLITYVLGPFVSHSPQKGAMPTLMAALSPKLKGGEYIGPQGFREMKGKPGKAYSTDAANDEGLAKRLWQATEEMIGETFL